MMLFLYSYTNNQVLNVPIGGKIPDMDHMFSTEDDIQWSKELAVSALHYTGDFICTVRLKTVES